MAAHHALGPNGRLGMKEIPDALIWACGREHAMWVYTRILPAQMPGPTGGSSFLPQQMALRYPPDPWLTAELLFSAWTQILM